MAPRLARVLEIVLIAVSIVVIALTAPAVVVKSSDVASEVTTVELLKPDAEAPLPDVAMVMPAELLVLNVMSARTVVTLRSPETEPLKAMPVLSLVIAAEIKVEISMLRPSAAVRVTPPVLALAAALTPVALV